MDFVKTRKYSHFVLRIGISLVFLWFGINQLVFTEDWLGYLPDFVLDLGFSGNTIVIINGIFEVIFGVLLGIGLFTRLSSFLLFIHLIGIIISLGYNEIAIRDFGLMLATLAIFLHGPDLYSLDHKRHKQ